MIISSVDESLTRSFRQLLQSCNTTVRLYRGHLVARLTQSLWVRPITRGPEGVISEATFRTIRMAIIRIHGPSSSILSMV